ncbi:MAG: four helix bundle protein [Anaerolineae bacterium]|nr:four helix bundle protein [Chloroflexi bacterium CFX1]MCQ3947332.1 four helix bundle protein [Anaerolineae bacterium]MCZ2289783.1 four helix bundle protein [Anaerolineales bacterium]GER80188.1 four helix bundle protein [Candidatus Denitrolinea symbiosum]MCZ7549552.1 four helix bundle protein [Anaerolineales bacterium]
MKIEKFEDIRAWQQARELTNLVYDLTEKGNFVKDYRLRDQIQGAAGSIMHNIAEGFDDGSDVEFIRFLKYARRSASEVQSETYLALDRKYITPQDFQQVYDMATTTKKSINAFIAYLRKSKSDSTR